MPARRGQKGDAGPPGPVTGELPSGATLRGVFNVDFMAGGVNEVAGGSISFALRLASEPAVVIIAAEEPSTAACPGSVADPQAAPGTLCIDQNLLSNGNTKPLVVCDAECSGDHKCVAPGAEHVKSYNAGRTYIDGSWAVTARSGKSPVAARCRGGSSGPPRRSSARRDASDARTVGGCASVRRPPRYQRSSGRLAPRRVAALLVSSKPD